jgi:hypothetical protein
MIRARSSESEIGRCFNFIVQMPCKRPKKQTKKKSVRKVVKRIANPPKRPIKLHTTSWYVNAARSIGVARGSRNPD